MDKYGSDNRSNQMNPNHGSYHSSRGSDSYTSGSRGSTSGGTSGMDKAGSDNRSNQMNSNNSAYHSSRGTGGSKK